MERERFPMVEEVVLQIFSWLNAHDLCRIQAVNKFFCRLSSDNQLWKLLFFEKHPSRRLRGGRGILDPSLVSGDGIDGRVIKKLPRRAALSLRQAHRQNWKTMYSIAWNWEQGRCTRTHVQCCGRHDQHCIVRAATLSGPLTGIAIGNRVWAHFGSNEPPQLSTGFLYDVEDGSPVTSMALDQSPNTSPDVLRLASFHDLGTIFICDVSVSHLSSDAVEGGSGREFSRTLYHLGNEFSEAPTSRLRRSNIVSSAYHHPLLVTLSAAFNLLVYHLPSTSSPTSKSAPLQPVLQQSLHSYTSYPPSSMSLTRSSKSMFKLVVAYSVPVFPAHFTAGVCEVLVSLNDQPSSSLPNTSVLALPGSLARIISIRTASANIPCGWYDTSVYPSSPSGEGGDPSLDTSSQQHFARLAAEQWDRKVGKVAGVQTDGKWVVLGSEDGTLQVYRLFRPPLSSSNAVPMSLTYQQSLYGHTAGIAGLKVTDGRCVSLGREGVIRVWDLEEGWSVEVGAGARLADDEMDEQDLGGGNYAGQPAVVLFDERRIVTTDTRHGGVSVWRFDT